MAELLNPDSNIGHTRMPLGTNCAEVQRNSRCRFGQIRAPKRCIIEQKRGSHRVRRNQRVESANNDRGLSDGVGQDSQLLCDVRGEKSGDISVPRAGAHQDCSPSISPTSEPLSPSDQSASLNEHKRPRPEHQINPGDGLSSSAPTCLREPVSPVIMFGQIRSAPSGNRARDFVCEQSLLNKEKFQYLLSKEALYHPNNAFLYYVNPEVEDKVDAALRNEAVHNLRFMHNAFFNLSTETFCKAVNLIDRFIVKVKVKPKYMACVATASYCAASKLCHGSSKERVDLPAPDTLVHVTRCGGNAADLLRMEEILASKLSHDLDGVNAFDFLRTFIDTIIQAVPDGEQDTPSVTSANKSGTGGTAIEKGGNSSRMQLTQLIKRLMNRLEIALCSLEVYRFRPVCLALGILVHAGVKGLVPVATMCGVDWADVIQAAALVEELYEIYYRDPLPCNRRSLVWNLSRRTLFRIGYSSPTPLDTITEDYEPADEDDWLLPLLFEP
ncbi:cyclin-G2 [Clonorchis sinensis]|uniref:Cyclin-G2 n=1 Tax=Clonorchis sinensis TaxID=79923 RepID=G7YAE8_CLOSI|nr:cyclin-G2 [Clonorchis sinensis]